MGGFSIIQKETTISSSIPAGRVRSLYLIPKKISLLELFAIFTGRPDGNGGNIL